MRDGAADFAMLPIENTTAGSINEAYDLLARMNLALVGEEVQKVEHCLLALDDVPAVVHQTDLFPHQGDRAVHRGLAARSSIATWSRCPTRPARHAKVRDDQDLSQAAIASEEAARVYGLKVLKRGIANQKENFTRFVVVGRAPTADRPPDSVPRRAFSFRTRHEEGALIALPERAGATTTST